MYHQNLQALIRRHPEHRPWLESLVPLPGYIDRSKTGDPVPLVHKDGPAVHSIYDPRKEAQRAVPAQTPVLLLLGLGGGYYLEEALRSPDRKMVLLWEPEPEKTFFLLQHRNLADAFSDPRFFLLKEPQELYSHYSPWFLGNLEVLSLASQDRTRPEFYTQCRQTLHQILERISTDQATQGKLGRAWMRNTWKNLNGLQDLSLTIPQGRRIWVAGAGPSLEAQIQGFRPGDLLISSDTASPFLGKLGLTPTVVLTLDPQIYSTLHFLPQPPSQVPLVADLGINPSVGRRWDRVLYFFSAHPLHSWLKFHGLDLPVLNTRGGNVTSTAVALADRLHPSEIVLAGADFSFPGGQIYVRDTYQYHYPLPRLFRTSPLETAQAQFLFQNPGLEEESAHLQVPYPLYRTPLQQFYKESLEEQGFHAPLRIPPSTAPGLVFSPPGPPPEPLSLKNKKIRVSDLKQTYYNQVSQLQPREPLASWLSCLNQSQWLVWSSLQPWLSHRVLSRKEREPLDWPIILAELRDLLE